MPEETESCHVDAQLYTVDQQRVHNELQRNYSDYAALPAMWDLGGEDNMRRVREAAAFSSRIA